MDTVFEETKNANINQDPLVDEIQALKTKLNAVILAHNYQVPEIQDLADYVGDSLGLPDKRLKQTPMSSSFAVFISWLKQPKY